MIHEHQGHGRRVLAGDDRGYRYGGGAEALLKDIETVNRGLRNKYPDLPLILMGHSMGSLAVRAFAASHDDCMDMLIVCGSPSNRKARRLGTIIARDEGGVLGSRNRNRLLGFLSFGSSAVKFRSDKEKNARKCSAQEVYGEYGR